MREVDDAVSLKLPVGVEQTNIKMMRIFRQLVEQVTRQTKAPSTPATMSKRRSTLLPPNTATMSNEFIVKFRPFDKHVQFVSILSKESFDL